MARIHPELLKRLQKTLGIGASQVYKQVGAVANQMRLPRHLAAIALGANSGININRFASSEDLTVLRQGAHVSPVPATRIPAEQTSSVGAPRRKGRPQRHEKRRGTSVFVVHGRDEAVARSLFAFLRSIGLDPLEWNKVISKTRKGSPYVGEILDAAFSHAVAVVVLLTPDDLAKLRPGLLRRNDPTFERDLTGQARPNVLFEAGMAFGKNSNSTVLVQVGNIRPFSDVGGRHVVHLSDSAESRRELITKLANAGCNVDTAGTHWITEGAFRIDQE